MNVISVGIDTLTDNPDNVRKHPETQLREMAKSLKMFGQTRPVVVDENNMILAGHSVVATLRGLGEKKVFIIKMSNLSSAQKTKLMLADNKLADLGSDDYTKLVEVLSGLGEYDIPGFDEESLKELLEDTEKAIAEYGTIAESKTPIEENNFIKGFNEKQGVGEGDNDKSPSVDREKAAVDRVVVCPHCGKEFSI